MQVHLSELMQGSRSRMKFEKIRRSVLSLAVLQVLTRPSHTRFLIGHTLNPSENRVHSTCAFNLLVIDALGCRLRIGRGGVSSGLNGNFPRWQDTGWYSVNYTAASNLTWGQGGGCAFAEDKCISSSGPVHDRTRRPQ